MESSVHCFKWLNGAGTPSPLATSQSYCMLLWEATTTHFFSFFPHWATQSGTQPLQAGGSIELTRDLHCAQKQEGVATWLQHPKPIQTRAMVGRQAILSCAHICSKVALSSPMAGCSNRIAMSIRRPLGVARKGKEEAWQLQSTKNEGAGIKIPNND